MEARFAFLTMCVYGTFHTITSKMNFHIIVISLMVFFFILYRTHSFQHAFQALPVYRSLYLSLALSLPLARTNSLTHSLPLSLAHTFSLSIILFAHSFFFICAHIHLLTIYYQRKRQHRRNVDSTDLC